MPRPEEPIWHPISALPMVGSVITGHAGERRGSGSPPAGGRRASLRAGPRHGGHQLPPEELQLPPLPPGALTPLADDVKRRQFLLSSIGSVLSASSLPAWTESWERLSRLALLESG